MSSEINGANGVAPTALSSTPNKSIASEANPNLLPDPIEFADPMAELEALMIHMKGVDKKYAREAGRLAEEAIQRAVDAVVADSKRKADAQMWSAVASGGGQIISGALQFHSATQSKTAATELLGYGAVAKGAGDFGAGAFNSQATALDGTLASHGSKLAAGERDAGAAQSRESEANQSLRDLLGRIEKIRQAEQGAQQAALFRA